MMTSSFRGLGRRSAMVAGATMVVAFSLITEARAALTVQGSPLVSPSSGCTWNAQYGNGGQTLPETDTDAAYWGATFFDRPGSVVTIQGSFPQARNMSFTVYNLSGLETTSHLYDAQIQPATGVNPFQQGQSGSGTYTLTMIDAAPPANPAPNTLYAGPTGLADVQLVYRVYDPTDPASPQGDVPLPQTTVTYDGKVVQANQPCVTTSPSTAPGPQASIAAPRVSTATRAASTATPPASTAARYVSVAERLAAPAPSWLRSKISSFYADPDNAYLGARVFSLFGQLVVVRAQMPTFPDTNTGAPPWAPAQVRYWSICENNGLVLPVVVACTDDDAAVETNGTATFVISSPANRPPNATAANGVNWLPWGTAASGVVLYRQMLADQSFGQSIQNATGSSLGATMGAYLPQIAYCSEAEFAAAGADGCLGSS